MNTKLSSLLGPGLTLLVLFSACSGGGINVSVEGPVIPLLPTLQTSEAITTHGAITGLNGITVNDVRYGTISVTVTANGEPGTLAGLKHGQIVTVRGTINSDGQSGRADTILYDANLIGPVEIVDAANDRLIVMGQSVHSDSDTRFGAGIDPATFAGLAVGSIVEVSGFRDAAGAIRATRIDTNAANSDLQIIGKVAGLDFANLFFTINRLTIDYSGAVFIDLPGGAPMNEMMVKAIGSMSNGLFVVERLVTAPVLVGNIGQQVQTAGVITRFNSRLDFDINNTTASVDSGTAFLNGDANDLVLNAELVVDGNFASSGRIIADRITFGHLVNDTATLAFDFRDFTEISVPTIFNVTVTQGPEFIVEVTVDDDVTNRIEVTKVGSRLNIALSQGNGNIETLEANITMPVLDSIDLTGVVNATLNGFNQARMSVSVGGVSRLHGNGLTIGNLTANVSGVSHLSFGDIRPIGFADIDIAGVSQATLNMNVGSTMTGSVGTGQGSGISRLLYYGTDVAVNVTKDRLSSIVRLGDTRP